MRDDNDFADVTLACEDEQQVEADLGWAGLLYYINSKSTSHKQHLYLKRCSKVS